MNKIKQNQPRINSCPGYFILAAKGFCMGASDVVPGVSGGTIAFILGIYEELINSIKSFDLYSLKLLLTFKIRRLLDRVSWQFPLTVLTGILTAIFSLAKLLSWLLYNEPVFIWSFFFGLILASIITVSRRVKDWRVLAWISLTGGISGSYFLVGIVPCATPVTPWFLFFCGSLSICAMMLPGISGSFILVLLGKYHYILDAVNERDFFTLFLFAGGAFVGIITFSRFLGWLLKNYHDLTVALLTGLMLGSLRKVWPFKETIQTFVDNHGQVIPLVQSNILPGRWNSEVTGAIIFMLFGLITIICLERLSKGNRVKFTVDPY
ncbi:MAG: DUF368 domain-containing protein [Deltaproteobacteria bacterium]|nr:DUF368 domain-containing protein [Deltaproteobacteria bacterium]